MSIQSQRIQKDLSQNPNAFQPVGAHTQNAVLGSAVTLSLPDGANAFLMQVTGQSIKYTLDGSAPTTTRGFTLYPTGTPVIVYLPSNGTTVRVIETAATATLDYQAIRVFGAG